MMDNFYTNEESLARKFLDEWMECNTVCDLGKRKWNPEDFSGIARVDYYMEILPGADYVRTQTLNYIFSNGITTGSINEDEILDDFLYRVNREGVTNLEVLRNSIATAISHGCCGCRWYDGDIYQYAPGTFRSLRLRNEDGILVTAGYIVSEKGENVPDVTVDRDSVDDYADIIDRLREQGVILLDTREFLNLRNDTSLRYGYSPLLHDQERIDLLVAVYERLNYDIKYDGPGRIVIRPKSGFSADGENEISTTEIVKQTIAEGTKRIEKIKEEAGRIGKELKESSSDSVIVLSNAFDKEITHLPRVTKATEFFDWIKNEGVILAQDFGMSPSLLELGGISGNVSMTSILDNAMLNSIVPLREKFAIQFSPFLTRHMDISKAFFNKYEMQQAENENTKRTQIANIISILNSINDDDGRTRPEALKLVRDFSEMLDENIHNENDKLEEL